MTLRLISESEIKSNRSNNTGKKVMSNTGYGNIGSIDVDKDLKKKMSDIVKDMGIEKVIGAHKIGYACVNTSIGAITNRTCRLNNCTDKRLMDLISDNLDGMKRIIEWNIQKSIMLYRISSVVIPYASHEVNTIHWWDDYKDRIMGIGKIIKDSGMRVSMHPGQYVNINSPDKGVVDFSVKELEYHAKFMDLLGLGGEHRIILHIGGTYGDKKASIKRFIDVYGMLSENIKSRLTIENDDKTYNVWDVLEVSGKIGVPVIFDLLHHQVNHAGLAEDKDIKVILEKCFSTWNKNNGVPKIHFSTQRADARYGVHADSIDINLLMQVYFEFINYNFDIMLETKDKEMSVLRAMKLLRDVNEWV